MFTLACNGKTYNRVWFTSDEHYSSERHIQLSRRSAFINFDSKTKKESYDIARMDATFIKNNNDLVGENDIVFHLGDFGNRKIVRHLKGDHMLILGNYEKNEIRHMVDLGIFDYNDAYRYFREICKKHGFVDVYTNCVFDDTNHISDVFGSEIAKEIEKIFLIHEPENCIYTKENGVYSAKYRVVDKNISDEEQKKYYTMNIFGHIHEKGKCKRFGVNVGVDCNHYMPVSSEDVAFYLNAILHHYDENVFM